MTKNVRQVIHCRFIIIKSSIVDIADVSFSFTDIYYYNSILETNEEILLAFKKKLTFEKRTTYFNYELNHSSYQLSEDLL